MQRDSLLADRFRLVKVIGRGGFGDVYQVEDLKVQGGKPLVAKIEKVQREEDATLLYEAKIMEYLKDIPAIPKIYAYGSERNYSYAVMDHAGITLSAIHKLTGNKFDSKVTNCNFRLY